MLKQGVSVPMDSMTQSILKVVYIVVGKSIFKSDSDLNRFKP